MTLKTVAKNSMTEKLPESNILGNLTKFTSNLHQKLCKKGSEFYSAYSISVALGMCLAGADNQTKNELKEVLKCPDDIPTYYKNLLKITSDVNKNYTLTSANALWISDHLALRDEYKTCIKNSFQGELSNIDFTNEIESVDLINQWADDKTNGKIKKIINEINKETMMILTNAIDFKGDWEKKFEKNMTYDAPFYGERTKLPTMHQTAEFKYYEGNQMKAIELPYVGQELSMIIMLPDENNTNRIDNDFENCYQTITNSFDQNDQELVQLSLPKFKFESSYELNDVISDLGAGVAFTNSADFSVMSDTRIKISKIIHKAFIKVDEKGSEAAAVTSVVMLKCCATLKTPNFKIFEANRPFVFCIKDNRTNEILFSGKFVKP